MTEPLRVLVADDEEMARARLCRLLGAIADVVVVAEARSGKDALALLDDVGVDVALLDVRMGLVSGLDAAARAAELGVEVVMTTAHRDHAVEAFERGAVDYLLKPIEQARLGQAIERARARVLRVAPPVIGAASSAAVRLPIEVRGEVHLVAAGRITHALLDDDGLVRVHLLDAAAMLTELSLSDLERRLPHLFRAHRRALVAIEHVARLRPLASGGYEAVLSDGEIVPVSRQSARELRRRLGL